MAALFRFPGFTDEDFTSFRIPERARRREEIIRLIHPKLAALGEDILADFRRRGIEGLYPHLPQLNWPPGYQPFCTWLALSTQSHRYQDLAQLNVGVHEPFVAVRLGFDTSGFAFGRLLFLMSHGDLKEVLARIAVPAGLRCRVYRRVPWPEGSRALFDSGEDFLQGVQIAEQQGAHWFEVGKIFPRESYDELLSSPEFAATAAQLQLTLYPIFRRLAGP
ncbi:MAG: DUF1054 family protein [Acidobacteria bacterium]|nr:DUF1054 family protein [Acidobacteriota bacterium]MCI0566715.1 DUF1054 family protein [Acidobacteriota bacterium]